MEVGGDRFSTACEGVLLLREGILKSSFALEVPVFTCTVCGLESSVVIAICSSHAATESRLRELTSQATKKNAQRPGPLDSQGRQPSTTRPPILRLHHSQNVRNNEEELSLLEPRSTYQQGTQPQHRNDRFRAVPSCIHYHSTTTSLRKTTRQRTTRKTKNQKESSYRRT